MAKWTEASSKTKSKIPATIRKFVTNDEAEKFEREDDKKDAEDESMGATLPEAPTPETQATYQSQQSPRQEGTPKAPKGGEQQADPAKLIEQWRN